MSACLCVGKRNVGAAAGVAPLFLFSAATMHAQDASPPRTRLKSNDTRLKTPPRPSASSRDSDACANRRDLRTCHRPAYRPDRPRSLRSRGRWALSFLWHVPSSYLRLMGVILRLWGSIATQKGICAGHLHKFKHSLLIFRAAHKILHNFDKTGLEYDRISRVTRKTRRGHFINRSLSLDA
jgi:hypothetical protein